MLTLVILASIAYHALAEMNPDQDLINKGLKFTAECMSKSAIKYDQCLEMFKDGIDLTDKKYDGCKCVINCVAKKFHVITKDGSYDLPGIEGYIQNLKTPAWKEEAKRVFPLCKDETSGANGCEAGFNLFSCAMRNSDKAKSLTMKLVKTLSGA
ncbi:uncharacterized protein LOC106666419 [Cimex lectularius]|uniref:Odorant binding protein n=1 Tax=Cimex lectularius TaxID=79782 RepID=A0A8I6TEA9_CIMLE|nr:uncharacterized protein LOC106666419 [Cimex lectularius]